MSEEYISVDEVRCFICDSTDDCPHLLAVIDRSYGSCDGGYIYKHYPEFEKLIENKFRKLVEKDVNQTVHWHDYNIGECWKECLENYSKDDDDIHIDSCILTDVVMEILECAGGELVEAFEPSGMGGELVIKTFYCENPQSAFEQSLAMLSKELDKYRVTPSKQ